MKEIPIEFKILVFFYLDLSSLSRFFTYLLRVREFVTAVKAADELINTPEIQTAGKTAQRDNRLCIQISAFLATYSPRPSSPHLRDPVSGA